MKENLINRMRSSSFMKMSLMALYGFLILYASAGIYDICAGDQFYLIEFIKYIGVDVFCIVFIQMEMIFHKENLEDLKTINFIAQPITWDAFITEPG